MTPANFKFQTVPLIVETFDSNQPRSARIQLMEPVDEFARRNHELPGFCNIAGTATKFIIQHDNLRETVLATISNSFNRQRQLVCGLSIGLFGHPVATLDEITRTINYYHLTLYTTEANGALFTQLKQQVRPELFFCSEYFGPEYKSGDMVNNIRHEDLQKSSFADASFDIILSAEIFEHIPDALSAEREVIRLLKPGGIYCFTVPTDLYSEHDHIHAEMDANGVITHYREPEYHGDPVRPEAGILVYRIFSYNDLHARFTAAGCIFTTYLLWSRLFGILGQNAVVHVVNKPPTRTYELPTGSEAAVNMRQAAIAQLAQERGNEWLAMHLADLVQYLVTARLHHNYFEYWQERGFHLTLNHYYEPVPDTRTLRDDAFWERQSLLPGIDMHVADQLHLLTECFPQFGSEYNVFPFDKPSEDHLFYLNNDLYSGTDALVLYCMVRHFKPSRVYEIGSGMSTTVAAQAAQMNGNTEVVAFEPYPNATLQRGFPGLNRLVVQPIQLVDPSEFGELHSGDILFIDTSHVVKTGGDVNYIYFELLPLLQPGVIIHIHDIFLPQEYKREWVLDEHRFWTEQYLVRAFLMYNHSFEVVYSNAYMALNYPEQVNAVFPRSNFWKGTSLWIRRKA